MLHGTLFVTMSELLCSAQAHCICMEENTFEKDFFGCIGISILLLGISPKYKYLQQKKSHKIQIPYVFLS